MVLNNHYHKPSLIIPLSHRRLVAKVMDCGCFSFFERNIFFMYIFSFQITFGVEYLVVDPPLAHDSLNQGIITFFVFQRGTKSMRPFGQQNVTVPPLP